MAIRILSAEQDEDLVLHAAVVDALGKSHQLTIDGERMRCEDHSDTLDIAQALGAEATNCAKWADDWSTVILSGKQAVAKFGGKGWGVLHEVALARRSLVKINAQTEPDDDPLATALGGDGLDRLLATTSTMLPGPSLSTSLLRRFDRRCGAPTQSGDACKRVLLSNSRCPCHGARVAR